VKEKEVKFHLINWTYYSGWGLSAIIDLMKLYLLFHTILKTVEAEQLKKFSAYIDTDEYLALL
jgi:hypothetical protein